MAISPMTIYYILVAVCATSSFLSVTMTIWLFYRYVTNWTQPGTQKLAMRVILIAPVWGILAMINVLIPSVRYIVMIFFDLYEGFAILSFMQLIYHYLGGKDQAQWKASTKHPYRCLGCLCMLTPGETYMKVLHVLIYQYIFFRPFLGILNCVLYYNGLLHEGGLRSGNPLNAALTIFGFVTLVVAMWALLQVYRVFGLILKSNNIGSKFLAIKVYVWLHVIQGFVFGFMASNQETEQQVLQVVRMEYTVLCFEMLLGALLNQFVFFKYEEFIDDSSEETAERITLAGNRNYNPEAPLLGSSH